MWLNPVNQLILTAAGCLLAAVVIVRVYQWLQRPDASRKAPTAGAGRDEGPLGAANVK